MNILIAKPVVKNQFWVVTDGVKKVGNVMATVSGYEVNMHGTTSYFDSTKSIQKQTHIEFQNISRVRPVPDVPYAVFPHPEKIYNSMYDVKRRLHLFTMEPKSKCYHVAGWFHMENEPMFCPKYIFIERYKYHGPFKTKDEAENSINI